MTKDENANVVNAYLDAFYSGDFSKAKSFVAETFRFSGPFVQAASRDAFFASAAGLIPIVKGHRLAHQWSDRDEVCSVFEMKLETPVKKGEMMVCEWHTLAEGKLVAGRVMLNVTEFTAFMPPRLRRRPTEIEWRPKPGASGLARSGRLLYRPATFFRGGPRRPARRLSLFV